MFKLGFLAAVAVTAAWSCVRAAPLEAYGKLPAVEEVAISPDGNRLALLQTDGEKRRIRIENLAQHRLERLIDAGEAKVRGVIWAGSDHVIILRTTTSNISGTIGSQRAEYLLGIDYNVVDGSARGLLSAIDRTALNIFYRADVRTIDGKPTLFLEGTHFVGNQGQLAVFRVDLQYGATRVVVEDGPDAQSFLLDANGSPVAETARNSRDRRWSLKFWQGGGWREVRTETVGIEAPVLLGLGRDGRSVLVGELDNGKNIVRELSPSGDWSEPLPGVGGVGLIFDPSRHNLIGTSALIGEEQKTAFFDERDQQVWSLIQHAYPGQRVRLVSWSDDRKKIVVEADSPETGPGFGLVDLATRHADWIANRYDQIGPNDIAPVRPVRFKAADGMALSGYLTLPRGRAAKALPLIVFPHGGPAARDEPGFDWWAQAMASRGYAVLQVNFRGSDGFGRAFLEAGFGQWGRKMQTDLSDGVRYLTQEGLIDPKRVCIVGASYGGYAAMAGPTLDPGVYRCAVAYAGIADMHSFSPWLRDQHGRVSQDYVMRFIGAKTLQESSVSEISPVAHLDKVDVPMLLIHGKDDTVVPLQQSRIMASASKAAGKPVDLMVLDSTDHWLTRGDTRLAMLKATMAFVERNNPPD